MIFESPKFTPYLGAPPGAVADPGFANGGAKVERRRREYRGAEGAEGVRCGEGVSPIHCGRGLGLSLIHI